MKKRVILIIACILSMVYIVACETEENHTEKTGIIGVLSLAGNTQESDKVLLEAIDDNANIRIQWFDDLNTMLEALNANRVDKIVMPSLSAKYLLQMNNSYKVSDTKDPLVIPYSMLLREGKENLRDRINEAYLNLYKKGEDQKLISNMNSKEDVKFTHFDDAETVIFAVTGDLPPMDYISEDGQASGYNIHLIAALCDEMKVNAEIITITSGTRAIQLTSEKADVVFWTNGIIGDGYFEYAKEIIDKKSNGNDESIMGLKKLFNEDGTVNAKAIEINSLLNKMDQPQHTIITNDYYTDYMVYVTK